MDKTLTTKKGKYEIKVSEIFNETKTEDDLAIEKYVLGEDLKGQPLENICNWQGDWSFANQLNGENVEFLNYGQYYYTENNEEMFDYSVYIKYKNQLYTLKSHIITKVDFVINISLLQSLLLYNRKTLKTSII